MGGRYTSRTGIFRIFTIVLLLLCIWTAYANVFSDDTALRARAGELAREKAGCRDACKVTNIEGSRGMLDERIEYEMGAAGHWTVVCRRAYFAFGDYACDATKR